MREVPCARIDWAPAFNPDIYHRMFVGRWIGRPAGTFRIVTLQWLFAHVQFLTTPPTPPIFSENRLISAAGGEECPCASR